MPDTTHQPHEINDNLDDISDTSETIENECEIDQVEPIETECEITTPEIVTKKGKSTKKEKKEPKKKAKKEPKKIVASIDLEDKIDELASLERKGLAKMEIDREIKNEKMRLAKRNGAEACNKIRADAKKKADLFDLYLSGELTRDACLLAGFTPQERKVVRKDPNNETISELRRKLFDF